MICVILFGEWQIDIFVVYNCFDNQPRFVEHIGIDTKYFPGWVFDKISIEANSELKLEAIEGVLESKFIKAGLSLKFLDKSSEINESNMVSRKTLALVQGLDQTKAKEITALIRSEFPKVKTQIQGEAVRVTSASRDDLQAVMAALKSAKFEFPVSFDNYR